MNFSSMLIQPAAQRGSGFDEVAVTERMVNSCLLRRFAEGTPSQRYRGDGRGLPQDSRGA